MTGRWLSVGLILVTLLASGASLVAGHIGVQADSIIGPGDNVTAVQPMPLQAAVCNNVNTGGVLAVATDYVLLNVDCWHTGSCPVCGGIDYGCSNLTGFCWVPSCPFVDPVPHGQMVSRIEAEVRGVSCIPSPIRIYINDTYIGEEVHPGHCECNGCYSMVVSGQVYASGFPGYVYGGANRLVLNTSGETCISEVRLKIYYRTPLIGTTSHSSSATAPSLPQQPVVNAALTVQNASLSQTRSAGGPVTVSAAVANTSTVTGTAVVKLYVNGQVAESRAVTVEGGKTVPVTFTLSGQEPGTYSVYVNTASAGIFTVDAAGGNDIYIYGVVILFALGIAGTLYFLVRKRAD